MLAEFGAFCITWNTILINALQLQVGLLDKVNMIQLLLRRSRIIYA